MFQQQNGWGGLNAEWKVATAIKKVTLKVDKAWPDRPADATGEKNS